MEKKFTVPDAAEITDLGALERATETVIQPGDLVTCINRGRKTLAETFDAKHVQIPPGYFNTEYGAALHFQKRLIVPGTRNIEVGGFVSWIGILGRVDGGIKVDDASNCQPFTDEELQNFGEKVEGIDRSVMTGADGDVQVIPTGVARSMTRGQSASMHPVVSADRQATADAQDAAQHIFDKPEGSDTRAAEAEAAAEAPPEAPPETRSRSRR